MIKIVYLVDKNSLNIVASIKGGVNKEDLQKRDVIEVESTYSYKPSRLKAVYKNEEIIVEPIPYIDIEIKQEGMDVIIKATVFEDDGSKKENANGELSMSFMDHSNAKILKEVYVEFSNGQASHVFKPEKEGIYSIITSHPEYTVANRIITVKEVS